jgi:hypothetical protein
MAEKKQETNLPRLALYVAGGFLLYKLAKKLGGFIQDPTGTEQESADLENQIDVNVANLTYPEFQYTSWANALEQALLIDLTEDERTVDGIVYQMQNDDDWKALVKAWGVRLDYILGYIPTASYTLPSAIRILIPENVDNYNAHFAGWNMQSRI